MRDENKKKPPLHFFHPSSLIPHRFPSCFGTPNAPLNNVFGWPILKCFGMKDHPSIPLPHAAFRGVAGTHIKHQEVRICYAGQSFF